MSEVFADTGYWAALQNTRDRLHGRALALTKEIEPRRIVTTQMVLVEVLNMFGNRGNNSDAWPWKLWSELSAAGTSKSCRRPPRSSVWP